MPKTRASYSSSKKLEVVEHAEIYGNRAASCVYLIGESSIREWRKQKPILLTLKPSKRCLRKRPAFWPQLETDLKQWIIEERIKGRKVSTVIIKLKAKEIATNRSITNFKGSDGWINSFMKRNQLVIRSVTSVGQDLPKDWQTKMAKFKLYVDSHKVGIEYQHIGNMDEVPMSFDMVSNFTVDEKGAQNVRIVTTGNEKCHFTVVLCVTADGGKCDPMVIFKKKKIPTEGIPKRIVVKANPKGWMNHELLCEWFENVWRRRKNSFFNKKSMLIYDSAKCHLTDDVKKAVNKYSVQAVIPGGLTKKLQPLDLTVNKSFKAKMRNKWEKWMVEGYHTFTKNGSMRRASYGEICHWIVDSWSEISTDCIKNGFRKANICDYDEIETIDSDSDNETIIQDLSEQDLNEKINTLHFETESDEDFDGFE